MADNKSNKSNKTKQIRVLIGTVTESGRMIPVEAVLELRPEGEGASLVFPAGTSSDGLDNYMSGRVVGMGVDTTGMSEGEVARVGEYFARIGFGEPETVKIDASGKCACDECKAERGTRGSAGGYVH